MKTSKVIGYVSSVVLPIPVLLTIWFFVDQLSYSPQGAFLEALKDSPLIPALLIVIAIVLTVKNIVYGYLFNILFLVYLWLQTLSSDQGDSFGAGIALIFSIIPVIIFPLIVHFYAKWLLNTPSRKLRKVLLIAPYGINVLVLLGWFVGRF